MTKRVDKREKHTDTIKHFNIKSLSIKKITYKNIVVKTHKLNNKIAGSRAELWKNVLFPFICIRMTFHFYLKHWVGSSNGFQ